MALPNARVGAGQRGFSLLELLIAIVATLFVSGAIFAMITAGNNAFRREPALADMQQNARIAMDLIQRDVAMAGNELSSWAQTFTPGLDGAGPTIGGVATDMLEILGTPGTCPALTLVPGGSGGSLTTNVDPVPDCYTANTGLVSVRDGVNPFEHQSFACAVAGPTVTVNPGVTPAGTLTDIVPAQWAHYEIVVDVEGIPNLMRSTTGPLGPSPCNGQGGLQLVARGIENFQVRYLMGMAPNATAFVLTPTGRTGGTDDWAGIVREVEVTITAMTTERLAGDRSNTAPNAVRTTLVSTIAPRAAAAAFIASGLGAGPYAEWE